MKFKCDCGQTLATDDSAVGMVVECPTCKKRQPVPPVDAPNVIKSPPAASPAPEWHTVGLRALSPAPEAPLQPSLPPPVLITPEVRPQPSLPPPVLVVPVQSQPPPAAPLKDVTTIPPRLPGSLGQSEYVEDLEEDRENGDGATADSTVEGEMESPLITPGEKKSLRILMFASIPALVILLVLCIVTKGAFVLFLALLALVGWLAGQFAAAYVRVNAIHVTVRQMPDLHRIVTEFAANSGKTAPEVYVLQGSAWNAMAMRFTGARMVVLLSGAVDSLLLKGDMRQVAWLVGHELGHHFAGHLSFRRRVFVNACFLFPWLVLWHRRQCELTCDRYGLVCAGSAAASMQALANMAAGAQLGPKVDAGAAVEQWMQNKGDFFVGLRTLYSSHPHNLCRIAEVAASARELNLPA